MSGFLEHTVKPFERWDHLAWHYYGSPAQYGLIIAANPGLAPPLAAVPEFLPVGAKVKIPIVQGSALTARPEDLPPWLR